MAGDGGALKDINEIKSQFRTREGFYKLLTLSDSQQRGGLPRGPSAGATLGPGAGPGSIPGGGVGLLQGPGAAAAAAAAAAASSSSNAAANSSPAGFLPPVRVSMVKLQPEDPSEESERVCFNIGRELYFYTYTNIKKINVAPRSNRLDAAKVLGTTLCPRMHEVPLLEPLVCKKIAHERLTVLVFMDDCIITACQEGLICTWARPGKANLTAQNGNSPSGTVV
ncbi:Dystrophia myotonica WD repeat-containing protein [Nibea albiflora]|uniref:Dystrophia myotonica WD repeat-containing protein n=1 Tax=Nibea albiflora TaxID=240163 RepID=A0ACB7EIB2_NIBAL|nr:Dystrophia myotonica WD repeat-containing protein [Nibea albiflora]